KNIANIYAVAPGVLTWLVHNFPSSGYLHAHTVQIKSAPASFTGGFLKVDISENKFRVSAFKADTLLLSKTYGYRAPADIAFYLLKICEVSGFAQDEVVLHI